VTANSVRSGPTHPLSVHLARSSPHLVHRIALNARPSPSFPPDPSHTQCSQAALPIAPHLSRPTINGSPTSRRPMSKPKVAVLRSTYRTTTVPRSGLVCRIWEGFELYIGSFLVSFVRFLSYFDLDCALHCPISPFVLAFVFDHRRRARCRASRDHSVKLIGSKTCVS
jgi:hypothetical protein